MPWGGVNNFVMIILRALVKVRTGARYDIQNNGRVYGFILVHLLILNNTLHRK